MNRIIGWMIACLLPISVLCATDNAKVCTSFTQQGRQVTFSPDGQCCVAATALIVLR